MDHKMYPTLGHIMWQTNALINVILANFGQHKGMPTHVNNNDAHFSKY